MREAGQAKPGLTGQAKCMPIEYGLATASKDDTLSSEYARQNIQNKELYPNLSFTQHLIQIWLTIATDHQIGIELFCYQ